MSKESFTCFEFPSKEAQAAKLFLPSEYDPYQCVNERRECFLDFDAQHNALKLLTVDTQEIMDIFHCGDVIGASVQVQLVGTEQPRAVETKNIQNSNSQETSSPIVDKGGIVLESLSKNEDKVFKVVSPDNAPKSSISVDSQAVATLTLYTYPRKNPSQDSIVTSCMGRGQVKRQPVKEMEDKSKQSSPTKLLHRFPCHYKFQVVPAEDFACLTTLVQAIRRLARPSSFDKSERLLIIVNPFSGRKKGGKIFTEVVQPMLEQAGIEHDVLITARPGHALSLMGQRDEDIDGISDVSKYDGLVAIGGDGSVYELLQGIKERPDGIHLLKRLKLGHIGAGTSNGLSASLAHASHEHKTATDYAFMVAKGKTTPIDLSRYETKSNQYISFLTFSWSFIADVDIESEVLRWLGWFRMEVYSVWRVLNLRKYRAKLSYLPPSAKKLSKLPPLTTPLEEKDGWVTIEDGICLLWVSQVTHAAETMINHPRCRPDDGLFHIFLVRSNVSRFRMLMILLALETGKHVDMDAAEFIDCTAYRFEPISKGSYNDLDGEIVESGPIQGIVLPGAAQAYCNIL